MFKKLKYLNVFLKILLNINVGDWLKVVNLLRAKDATIGLRNGLKFKVNSLHNLIQLKEIFLDEEYKCSMTNPDIIIDIGANFGDSSVYYAKNYPNSQIYAFEPGKVNRQLINNLKINEIRNVVFFSKGIGPKNGNVVFYDNRTSGLSSIFNIRKGAKKRVVQMITLSSLFKKLKISKCNLLKMDCEGAEYEVLMSLKPDILNKIRNFVIEYHDGLTKYSHLDLINFFKENKYKYRIKKHKIEANIGIIYASK